MLWSLVLVPIGFAVLAAVIPSNRQRPWLVPADATVTPVRGSARRS